MVKDRHDQATGDLFQPLAGLTIVVTGRLATMTRRQAWATLEELGATIRRKVTKRTDLVLVGKKPGQNAQRAKKFGVRVIREEDLLEGFLWKIRANKN